MKVWVVVSQATDTPEIEVAPTGFGGCHFLLRIKSKKSLLMLN